MRRLLNGLLGEMEMPVWWVVATAAAMIGMSVWLAAELW